MSARVGVCLLALRLLSAQTPDTAVVHGQVSDQSHAAIAGAKIAAKNTQTGLERAALTDVSGHYSVSGLPAGKYEVTAVKAGFADTHLNGVTLAGGSTAEIDLQLNVAGGQTQIVVTGAVGEVRMDAPQLGALLDEQQIDQTPLSFRRITSLPLL